MLRHDLFQECEAVHARHLDIEGDDIGDLFAMRSAATKGSAAWP